MFYLLPRRAGGILNSLCATPEILLEITSTASTEPREPLTHRDGPGDSFAANKPEPQPYIQHCVLFAPPAGLVLAWTRSIATGDGDIAVIIAEPESRAPASVCHAEVTADGSVAVAAESTEAREWSRFFSPMAHLCVFSSQQVSAPIQGRTPQEPQAASSVHDAPLSNEGLGASLLVWVLL